MDDEFDFQILQLTDKFYTNYPNPPYIEILKKEKRSYNCVLIQSQYGYFLCIPYRSEINHEFSYRFKATTRSKKHKSGLDYTKMVIISDLNFLGNKTSTIDQDEYNETRDNICFIQKSALKFVNDYIAHIRRISILHKREFSRRYRFSPLKYFHKELGIIE